MNIRVRKPNIRLANVISGLGVFLVVAFATPVTAERVSLSGIKTQLDGMQLQLDGLESQVDQLSTGQSGTFDASRYVSLRLSVNPASPCSAGLSFVRLNLDGSAESSEFVVPIGYTLLLTDINWEANRITGAFVAGRVLRMELRTVTLTGSQRIVYQSPQVQLTATNLNAPLGASENLTTGVAFPERHRICPRITMRGQTSSSSSFSTVSVSTSTMRGVLIPNSP